VSNSRFTTGLSIVATVSVLGAVAWLALPHHSQQGPLTTTASLLETTTQHGNRPQSAAELILARTNRFREGQDLEPVESSDELTQTARYFAGYMARAGKFSHTADGQTPSERVRQHGYEYCLVSENIAFVSGAAPRSMDEVTIKMVEGWMLSPEHRANMLDPAVTEMGTTIARSPKSGTYFGVQMFGRPKSLTIHVTIENQSKAQVTYTIGPRPYELPAGAYRTHYECLPNTLGFQLPATAKTQRHSFRLQDGDHFYITGADNNLRISNK
jgi:uncharacterized protein YkwD